MIREHFILKQNKRPTLSDTCIQQVLDGVQQQVVTYSTRYR